jgi:uncharacterized spore protein YtfJ
MERSKKMSTWSKAIETAERNQAGGMQTLDKLFAVTQPGAVYSQPVHAQGQTVITLSEVTGGIGFGYGIGEGGPAASEEEKVESLPQTPAPGGGGGGGGGGGFSAGRPVAIVSITADSVKVKPVVDVTKLGIAALTTFGAMALMFARMNRVRRR